MTPQVPETPPAMIGSVSTESNVLPQAEINELKAEAVLVAGETGVDDPQEKGSLANNDPEAEKLAAEQAAQQQAAAAQTNYGKGFDQPRHLHPLNRLRRVETVLDRILEHMGASSNSPISPEDATELREYLKNGNGEAEDEDDD